MQSEPMLDASLRWHDKMKLDPGLRQGDKRALYNFPESFDWEKHFPEATHKIRHVEHQTKFWRLMFDNLYLIQELRTPHANTSGLGH